MRSSAKKHYDTHFFLLVVVELIIFAVFKFILILDIVQHYLFTIILKWILLYDVHLRLGRGIMNLYFCGP